VIYGHGEDVLAPLRRARRRPARRPRALGGGGASARVAIASKQWALLAVPALWARSPRRERPGLAAASLALPAAPALLVLAVGWSHASPALFHPPNYPQFGHAALWVDAGAATVATAPARLAITALAGVLAGRAAGGSWTRPPAVLGLILLARCAFEPVVHAYYLAPGLCMVLLHERVITGRCARTAMSGGLLPRGREPRHRPVSQ
jgi:hypothetical protein